MGGVGSGKAGLSSEERQNIINDFHSDLSLKVVAAKYHRDASRTISRIWKEEFTESKFKERTSRLCRMNQLGDKNSMFGKLKMLHPDSKHYRLVTSQGYYSVLAPDWYTGKTDGRRVLEHILVYCIDRNICELPDKHVVHHIDGSRTNNNRTNLIMLSIGDHLRLHNVKNKEGATTIREE